MSVFMIVGTTDPLYEVELRPQPEDNSHLNQFVLHSALDMVEETMWSTQGMYLKQVDRFNEHMVSAFVTAGSVKFLLLHESRNDDGIKNFFYDVYELYLKVLANPFYDYDAPINSSVFDVRVKALARRYL